MRHTATIVLFVIIGVQGGLRQASAQDGAGVWLGANNNLDLISLSVIVPTSFEGLSAGQLTTLHGKIQRMVTRHGLSGDGHNADLVIYPTFEIYHSQVQEGLQRLTIVRGAVNLYVKHVGQNVVFASYSIEVQGSGVGQSNAVTDALRGMRTNAPGVQRFLEDAKARIVDYYEVSCDGLIREADTYAAGLLFDQALGKLMMVPAAASSCYERSRQKSVALYQDRRRYCGQQVQAARAAMVQNEYAEAVQYLVNVDPTSSCHAEAVAVMQSMQDRVDERERRYYKQVQQAYRDAVELKKERLHAVRDVAIAYYLSRPRTVVYQSVVYGAGR